MTNTIGPTPEERELIERLTDCIHFSIYDQATERDVQSVIESLAERDEFSGDCGWIIVKEDKYDALNDRVESLISDRAKLREALEAMPQLLCNLAQLLDGWRSHEDWTEWDSEQRTAITAAMMKTDAALDTTKGQSNDTE